MGWRIVSNIGGFAMGVALVLLSAVAYGLITAFILTIINEIAILIHVGAVLEQPFIVKILTTLHLSVDSFSAACVWTVLLYVAFIVLFQLPPVQSLQLKFKNIYYIYLNELFLI